LVARRQEVAWQVATIKMDAHSVGTGEDALLLYLNPKGELQEKQKWEDGGERHFCSTQVRQLSPEETHKCVLW
jgi:chorismate mutase